MSAEPERMRPVVIVVCAIVVAILGATLANALAADTQDSTQALATLLSIGLGVVCLIPLVRASIRRADVLTPLVLVPLVFLCYYPLRGLVIASGLSEANPDPPLKDIVLALRFDYLIPALVVALVALVSFAIGHLASRVRLVEHLLPPIAKMPGADERCWPTIRFIALAGGAVAAVLTVSRFAGGPEAPGLGAFSELLSNLGLLGFALMLCDRLRRRRPIGILLAVVGALGLVVLSFGYRYLLLQLVVVAGVCWSYSRHRLSAKHFAVGAFFLVLVLTPLSIAMRASSVDGSSSAAQRFLDLPSTFGRYDSSPTPRLIPDPSLGTFVQKSVEGVSTRLYGLDTLIAVVGQVPKDQPYATSERLRVLADTFLIPRIFVSSKAAASVSDYFKLHIWHSNAADQSNQKPGFLGDLYMSGGYPAVIMGWLLFGFVAGGIRRWFTSAPPTDFSIAAYAVLLNALITIESDVVLFLAGLLTSMLAVASMALLARTHLGLARSARR